MLRNFILLWAILSFTMSAHAEWVYVCQSADGTRFYANSEGVERFPGYNRVWTRTVYPEINKFGDAYSTSQKDFDTERASYRVLCKIFYRQDGSVSTSLYGSELKERDWIPAPPDSTIYKLWEMCRHW
jgi:hypothetical protein